MIRQVTVLTGASLALAGVLAFAQTARNSDASSGAPTKAQLERVIATWASRDVDKAAVFYAKDPGLVFYDIAPRKYTGWAEYGKGARDMFKSVTSLTMKMNDDAVVHVSGNMAWSSATVDGEMVGTDGSRLKVEARWTTVWESRPTGWLIVHEHFSNPLPEPPPPKPKA